MTRNIQVPPAAAMEIANWFLIKGWREEKYRCDQLKLYKLVYYAHAWHLGNGAGPLFSETVEAWPHGPVVPELYQAFNGAGRNPIFFLGGYLGSYSVYAGKLETNLEKIWKTYKKHSGISLSNATHHPGEPWRVVAESCDVRSKPPIPNDTIAGIFRKKVEKISNEENSQDC